VPEHDVAREEGERMLDIVLGDYAGAARSSSSTR
jgi:hypothetical protein